MEPESSLTAVNHPVRCEGTFSLVAQFVVVLSKFGDQLSSLQLDLRVGGQVVGRGALSDHSIGLNVQIPVDTENNKHTTIFVKSLGGTNKTQSTEKLKTLTHTAGLYGAGAGLGVVGVAGGACLSSVAEFQGLTPGVLGEMGVVGSTWKQYTDRPSQITQS